jgi:16S rRNA (uracil1498-N3)-methyltransferase
MADRYFVESPIEGSQARLVGGEAHHLAHVMRAKVGHEVTLFDGSGAEFPARVERIERAEIVLAVPERREVSRELPFELTLAVALPKGDRRRWLVEKAVELGVTRLLPLQVERAIGQDVGAARLRQTVIEASKQCGRNRLLEIAEPAPLAGVLDGTGRDALRLIAHTDDDGGRESLGEILARTPIPSRVALAIGPEGGFTDGELQMARADGWIAISLGPRILRVETAALAATATIVAHYACP